MTDAMAESAVLRIDGQLDTDVDRDEQIVM
jgi:hypothetical protein